MNITVDGKELADSFKKRIYNIDYGSSIKKLVLTLTNGLPLIITDDKTVEEVTIKEESFTSNLIIELTDDDFPDRMVYISTVISPITKNKVILYYDKKYKDIVLIPNIRSCTVLDISGIYEVNGYMLGSTRSITFDINPDQLINIDYENRFSFPETNSNINTIVSKIVQITGISKHSNRSNTFLTNLDANTKLINYESYPSTLIRLGKASEIFKSATNLPVYLMYQFSFENYGIKFCNKIDTKDNYIYISLKF